MSQPSLFVPDQNLDMDRELNDLNSSRDLKSCQDLQEIVYEISK
jgi:hypothetical protein